MSWFRMDDRFHSHPKTLAAGNAAVGLWARCGCYCSDHNLEGRVPKAIARSYGTKSEINRLLFARLWIDEGDAYVMPDWLDYNPSAEQTRARRKADAERQRRGREAQMSRRDTPRDSRSDTPRDDTRESDGGRHAGPDPTRPVLKQVRENSTSVDTRNGGKDASNRAANIADNYARIALAGAHGINNPDAYAAAARKSALANRDLERFLERFPEAPDDAIAAWLHGDKHSMAYYATKPAFCDLCDEGWRKDGPAPDDPKAPDTRALVRCKCQETA